jgi:hypothetical protein
MGPDEISKNMSVERERGPRTAGSSKGREEKRNHQERPRRNSREGET